MLVVKAKMPVPEILIKDGTYDARVSNITQFENSYGPRIGFEFCIIGGEYDGQIIMRSTAPQLTRQSKLVEVIEGILGRPLTDHEMVAGFDLEDLLDLRCSILVLQSRSKSGAVYASVERVFRA